MVGVERYARGILLELDQPAESGEVEMAIPPGMDEVPRYRNNLPLIKDIPGEIYNICSGSVHKLSDIIDRIASRCCWRKDYNKS